MSIAAEAPDAAKTRPSTVKEILDAAGGPGKIAEASEGVVSVEAVYKWPKIGIPDRHWPFIMGLCDVSAAELLAANIAARAPVDLGQE
jgi:hypothetical protein